MKNILVVILKISLKEYLLNEVYQNIMNIKIKIRNFNLKYKIVLQSLLVHILTSTFSSQKKKFCFKNYNIESIKNIP